MIVGIFAAGRNGSTLLTRLLDGSSDLWVHPVEMNYLSVFSDLSRFKRVRSKTHFFATNDRPLALGGAVKTELLLKYFWPHIDEVRNLYMKGLIEPFDLKANPLSMIQRQPAYRAHEFLPALVESIRAACDERAHHTTRYPLIKTAEISYIREYSETFPDMRFIHLIRHPLTNYSSLKRTSALQKEQPFWYLGGDMLHTFLEMRWIPHARFIIEQCNNLGNDKHYLVKYEDLCSRPTEIISDICHWLQISMPRDPSLQTVLGGKQMTELPVNSSKRGIKTPPRVVSDMATQFDYEDILTEREKEFIVFRTYSLASQLGYFTRNDHANVPNRLDLAQQWLLPDKWELMNSHYKAPMTKLRLALALLRRRRWIYSKLLFSNL